MTLPWDHLIAAGLHPREICGKHPCLPGFIRKPQVCPSMRVSRTPRLEFASSRFSGKRQQQLQRFIQIPLEVDGCLLKQFMLLMLRNPLDLQGV